MNCYIPELRAIIQLCAYKDFIYFWNLLLTLNFRLSWQVFKHWVMEYNWLGIVYGVMEYNWLSIEPTTDRILAFKKTFDYFISFLYQTIKKFEFYQDFSVSNMGKCPFKPGHI